MVSDLLSSERAGVIALEFVSRGFSDLDDCTAVRNATAAPGEQQLAIGTPPPSDGPKGSDTARLPAAADSTDCGGIISQRWASFARIAQLERSLDRLAELERGV